MQSRRRNIIMSELDIKQKDYCQAVIVSDFIAKTKNIIENNPDITDITFIPVIKGYDIRFKAKNDSVYISLRFKRVFTKSLKIKFHGREIACRYFSSKNREENTTVLNKIFNQIKKEFTEEH